MNNHEMIIQQYSEDEQTMIRLFIHWCKTNELDPIKLYQEAYPNQAKNELLIQITNEEKEEPAVTVSDETILDVLQLFGNEDLAFVISNVCNKR